MGRRAVATGALAAMAAADALLVLLALRPAGGAAVAADVAAGGATPAVATPTTGADRLADPTATATAEAGSGATPTTASPTASLGPSAATDRVLLSVGAGGAAAWARTGTCGADAATGSDDRKPRLEVTSDGKRWRSVAVPVASLLRVKSVDAREVWAVGTDRACATKFVRSTDGGTTWKVRNGSAGAWHLLPAAKVPVHAPGAAVGSPCADDAAPLDLAAVSPDRALLLCPGGRVLTTKDGGKTWHRTGTAPGATALAVANDDGSSGPTAYAAAPAPAGSTGTAGSACHGIAVLRSSDGGKTWKSRGCAELGGDAGSATGQDQPVALSFGSPTNGLLATADALFRTRDGGRTWHAVHVAD